LNSNFFEGPLPNSVPHFWQMVLENNVQLIVMLTKLSECKKSGGSQEL
jgi:protein tyrosine phosphatase